MKKGILVLKENGDTKVKITNDGYGLELYTMRNGFQWTGQGVTEEMLHMIRDAINDFLAEKK